MSVKGGVDYGGFFVGDGFLAIDAIGVGGKKFLEDLTGNVDAGVDD